MALLNEKELDIACSPLCGVIFVGQSKEDPKRPGCKVWVKKVAATERAIIAVADHLRRGLEPGYEHISSFVFDGKKYELTFSEVAEFSDPAANRPEDKDTTNAG